MLPITRLEKDVIDYDVNCQDECLIVYVGDVSITAYFNDHNDGIDFIDCRAKSTKSPDDKRKFVAVENSESVSLVDFELLNGDLKTLLWSLLLNEVVVEYGKYMDQHYWDVAQDYRAGL